MTKFIFGLNTLLISGSTLEAAAGHFGHASALNEIIKDASENNVPFIESLIRQVHLLGDIQAEKISAVIEKEALFGHTAAFIAEHGENCAVASEYPGQWTSDLLKRFGCAYYTSEGKEESSGIKKLSSVLKKENIVERYKSEGCKTVFIGSDNADMEAMRAADISIASGLAGTPPGSVLSVADYLVFTEAALCRQLNQLL